jgi:hypothetical protein
MASSTLPSVHPEPKVVNRWVQMIAGIIAMMAIASLQYTWTLFVRSPIVSLPASPPSKLRSPCFSPYKPALRRHLAGEYRPISPRYGTEFAVH